MRVLSLDGVYSVAHAYLETLIKCDLEEFRDASIRIRAQEHPKMLKERSAGRVLPTYKEQTKKAV